jgi:hypothetical protein
VATSQHRREQGTSLSVTSYGTTAQLCSTFRKPPLASAAVLHHCPVPQAGSTLQQLRRCSCACAVNAVTTVITLCNGSTDCLDVQWHASSNSLLACPAGHASRPPSPYLCQWHKCGGLSRLSGFINHHHVEVPAGCTHNTQAA